MIVKYKPTSGRKLVLTIRYRTLESLDAHAEFHVWVWIFLADKCSDLEWNRKDRSKNVLLLKHNLFPLCLRLLISCLIACVKLFDFVTFFVTVLLQ